MNTINKRNLKRYYIKKVFNDQKKEGAIEIANMFNVTMEAIMFSYKLYMGLDKKVGLI